MVSRILTLGGHDFTSRPPDRAVSELMLRLATERSGKRPKICILPTASGDTSEQIGRFYAAFGERPCAPSDLSLFRLGRRPMALRDHLLDQDLIYVGGGSMVNLLAVWEAHDLSAILSLAWRQGIVLAGQSAGAMCWFESGITKSSGKPEIEAGLGLLHGSLCVHYNNEPERRAAYLEAVSKGMPSGYGLDDYAGLLVLELARQLEEGDDLLADPLLLLQRHPYRRAAVGIGRLLRLDVRDVDALTDVEQVLHHHHRVLTLLQGLAVEEGGEPRQGFRVVIDGCAHVLLRGCELIRDLLIQRVSKSFLDHCLLLARRGQVFRNVAQSWNSAGRSKGFGVPRTGGYSKSSR